MKSTILIFVIFLAFLKANGTNYFLSSSSGNDILDGKSANTAWQTTRKLNASMSSLQPGDSILFKCNDTFNGQIYISTSGTDSKNIYFGSYGSGKKPVISGTAAVTNWVQTKTNIWEATCTDCGSKVSNFFINGIPQQIGRWPNASEPNKGYLSYESSTTNQISDNQLTNTIDWTGAEAVVRRVRWVLGRLTIKSHDNGTLQFNVNSSFSNGFGYFIQNDPKTLDQQGEWYYNPTKKEFSLYSITDPNTLITMATKLDYIIRLNAANYITIENLQFSGSVSITMDVNNCNRLTIRNIELNYSGENGLRLNGSNNVLFESNLINHTNNNAFIQTGCKDFMMRNNRILNTALIAGMGLGGDDDYNAVTLGGTNMLAEYNTIDSVGYVGLRFSGDLITIKNNVISNFCITKDDGGGLYTWSQGTPINYSRKLIGNIITNAIGAPEGTGGNQVAAEGIYIDDRSANVDIIGNSVYQCGNNGIYIHNSNHINIHNNTIYDNGIQILMRHDNAAASFPITNCKIDSNVFVSRTADQLVASYETIDKSISFPDLGTFDFNSYCRPMDDHLTIHTKYINGAQVNETINLESWQTNYNKDMHSNKSPITLEQYNVYGAISSNFFLNSDFESNISGWTTSSKYGNGRIALAKGEGHPGNALKASFISSSGKADGYMIVISNNFEMTQGKTYRLRFSAKSSQAGITLTMV
ncbi:MAG: right-handed parallel beta-helix repeat-containing protein, partial [Chloroflexota bacterium]